MTFGELKRQILNLGFETADAYDEEPSIMVDSVNRAMREITNLFPLTASYQIIQYPLPNLLPEGEGRRQYDGEHALVFRAQGARSLYFECTGSGLLRISDADGAREMVLESGSAFRPYRALVRGTVELHFSGPFAYELQHVALYGQLRSQRLADIPACGPYLRYDLDELTRTEGADGLMQTVFLDFLDKVQEADGTYRSLHDFHIEGRSTLVLPGKKQAAITVFYRRNFMPLTAGTPESYGLELPPSQEHLLPLLAAWYVWADDEPAKAAKWRNDYEDFAQRLLLMEQRQKAQTEAFCNKLGW